VNALKKVIAATLVMPVFLLAMILLHEAGHAGAVKLLVGIDCEIFIWPGFEIYPQFGHEQAAPWNGSLAFTKVTPPEGTAALQRVLDYHDVILFMGSGFTQLLSLMSLAALSLIRPQGMLLWLLVPGALLHTDMLSYTIFPLLHMRHLVFWGGSNSETLIALAAGGIPQYVAVPAILLLSLGQFLWLSVLLRSRPLREKQPGPSPIPEYR
jgi:hypothetical protein